MTSRCRVALAGFGTVGRSVARSLQERDDVELVAILNREVERKRVEWIDRRTTWTESFDDLLRCRPDVFVELIGGRAPAADWIRRALEAGIPVVTANKQVIAHDGASLLGLAAARGTVLRFEGAVAGGVPVIRAIESGLAGDALTLVAGILNGTCNYILTRMERDAAPFDEALREAQALGFAEADASQDIDGLDAQAKLAVLVMVAFGLQVSPAALAVRSIATVGPVDFVYAKRLGCTIRQIAWAERIGSGVRAAVGPALVALDSPFAGVGGSGNLVAVHGRSGGTTTFGGRGAGGDPTAVAVVSDVLAIARGTGSVPAVQVRCASIVSADAATPCYVRFTVADRPGIIAALAAVFARHDVNIDAVLQEPGYPPHERPFIVSLDAAPWPVVETALGEIERMEFHVQPPLALPVLTGVEDRPVATF
jgi:homoserine dehydrogenase